MADFGGTARRRRTLRLSRYRDSRYLVVPLDHTFADGPMTTAAGFPALVDDVAEAGADAIVMHKGRLRHLTAQRATDCSIIAQLNGGTRHGENRYAKTLVAGVEEALSLGADAVSLQLNVGSVDEDEQFGDFGTVAGECHRLGVPLMAMAYVCHAHPTVTRIRHAVSIAVDLGADIVKCGMPDDAEDLLSITESSPVPVVVAGGEHTPAEQVSTVCDFALDVLKAGGAGLAIGRRVFDNPRPYDVVAGLVQAIHHDSIGDSR